MDEDQAVWVTAYMIGLFRTGDNEEARTMADRAIEDWMDEMSEDQSEED